MALMNLLVKLQQQCQRSWCHHEVNDPLLLWFLLSIIISVMVSLGRPYVKYLLHFSLNVWNQMLWRNLWKIVLPWDLCTYSFDDLIDCQNLWCCGSISLKTILIFHKNFLNFRLDTIEKQDIINFSSYNSKGYASVDISDSEVSFVRGRCSLSFISLLCFVYTQCWIIEEVCHQIFLSSILHEVFHNKRSGNS